MSNVFANGRVIIHQGDGLVQTAPTPDVCKTPTPGGPVPVPYPNMARDGDLADGTDSVKIAGSSVAVEGACLSTSSGDEAGTAGGVISSKFKGKLTWGSQSADVKFEDKGVIRFLDLCYFNSNTGNALGPDGGEPALTYGGDAPCSICGKENGHPLPSQPETASHLKEVAAAAPPTRPGDSSGYMMGVLRCVNKFGEEVMLVAHSGPPVPGLPNLQNPGGKKLWSRGGQRFDVQKVGDGARPGNCAAPKLLEEARRKGLTPLGMTEAWQGPSPPSGKAYVDGEHAASCDTCKVMLPAMLCDQAPAEQQ